MMVGLLSAPPHAELAGSPDSPTHPPALISFKTRWHRWNYIRVYVSAYSLYHQPAVFRMRFDRASVSVTPVTSR